MRAYDALGQYDKLAIRKYIEVYGNVEVSNDRLGVVLYEWCKSKSFLFEKVFDGQLRRKFKLTTAVDRSEMLEHLKKTYNVPYLVYTVESLDSYLIYHSDDADRNPFVYNVIKYIKELIDRIPKLDPLPLTVEDCLNMSRVFINLIKYDNIISNSVGQQWTYSYPLFDKQHVHKRIVRCGSKTIKAVRTFLIDIGFDQMDLFDSWRNKLSEVTTIKEKTCDFVLSIHPIDFMTMSDNDCNWTSCMSWNDGEYSNGSVEMMNSPFVVIGYTESEDKPECIRGGYSIPNKSWRCLFYVSKELILSGKAYPYNNPTISRKGIEILREMVGDAFGNSDYYGHIERYDDMDWYYSHYDGSSLSSYETIVEYMGENSDEWTGFDFEDEYEDERYDEDESLEEFCERRLREELNGRCIIYTGDFMYNDLFEDSGYGYLCAKKKGLSGLHGLDFSGACSCMCCGNTMYLSDVNNSTDKFCFECKDRYECEDDMLRPDDEIYEFYTEDNYVRMTERQAESSLWFRPYIEKYMRKDASRTHVIVVQSGDADVKDIEDCIYNDGGYDVGALIDIGVRAVKVDEGYANDIYHNDSHGLKIELNYIKRGSDWKRKFRYYSVDDIDAFLKELSICSEIEEVDISDERQSNAVCSISRR